MEISLPSVPGVNPKEPPLCQKAEISILGEGKKGQGMQPSEVEDPDLRAMPGQTLTQKAEERTTTKCLSVFICPQSQLKA